MRQLKCSTNQNDTINKTTNDMKNDELDNVKPMIGANEASIDKNEEMSDHGGHYDDTNDSGINDEADDALMIDPDATWINKLKLNDKWMLSDTEAGNED